MSKEETKIIITIHDSGITTLESKGLSTNGVLIHLLKAMDSCLTNYRPEIQDEVIEATEDVLRTSGLKNKPDTTVN